MRREIFVSVASSLLVSMFVWLGGNALTVVSKFSFGIFQQIPPKTIAAFHLSKCPTGWYETIGERENKRQVVPAHTVVMNVSRDKEGKPDLATAYGTSVQLSGGGAGQLTAKSYLYCEKR